MSVKRRRRYQCVVVDLNTQHDFCHPNGARPVENVRDLIPALRHVVAWTKRNGAPMVSSVESHRPVDSLDDRAPSYCVDGTPGQRKIDFTLLDPCTFVQVDNTLCCAVDLFNRYQQVVFRKRTDDLLSNPKADRFFNLVGTTEFILVGVALEESVKALALGLLAREKRVTVIADACGYWSQGTADLAVRQLTAKGAKIITVAGLLRRKLAPRARYLSGPGGGLIARSVDVRPGAAQRNGRTPPKLHVRPPQAARRPIIEPTESA